MTPRRRIVPSAIIGALFLVIVHQGASADSTPSRQPAETVEAKIARALSEYMLAGATQRSDSDPFDKTDPPIKIGPHWMILWPFDPKTSGLPTVHKATGAYIMYAGTPWAHVHVMGAP